MVAVVVAGCGKTTFFAGRNLPPSGLTTRVLIAIQNPSPLTKGALQIVDAFYDTRYKFNNTRVTYSISGFSGALPISIQNMPEEQLGAIYGSGDGSFTLVSYGKENSNGAVKGLTGTSSSIFITRNTDLRDRRTAGRARFDHRESEHRRGGSAWPSRHLSRQREPRRFNGAGLRAELELRLLPEATDGCADYCLLRRLEHLAQGGCRLRAAEWTALVPFPGAEPRRHRCDREHLWRTAGFRPAHQGGVLDRMAELRTF